MPLLENEIEEGEYNSTKAELLVAIHGTLRSIFALNFSKVETLFLQSRLLLVVIGQDYRVYALFGMQFNPTECTLRTPIAVRYCPDLGHHHWK